MNTAAGCWLYRPADNSQLYTVGFYAPDGTWCPESDHLTLDAAAARCRWLSGGNPADNLTPVHPEAGAVARRVAANLRGKMLAAVRENTLSFSTSMSLQEAAVVLEAVARMEPSARSVLQAADPALTESRV